MFRLCFCLLFLLIFFFIVSSSFLFKTKDNPRPEKIINSITNLNGTVINSNNTIISDLSKLIINGCECKDFSCGCCSYWQLPEIHLNSSICINMSYLPHDYGLSFTMTIDSYTVYNETISVRNPPPICIGSPYVEDLADICIRFYNLDADLHHLHICCKLEARFKHIHIAQYDFGCLDLKPKNISTNNSTTTTSILSTTSIKSSDSSFKNSLEKQRESLLKFLIKNISKITTPKTTSTDNYHEYEILPSVIQIH